MYKHILVATDGSKLSGKAIRTAARLARSLGSRLTGAYVTPAYVQQYYFEGAMYAPPVSSGRYKQLTARAARKALAVVEIEAQAERVPCTTVQVTNNWIWEGILRTARAKKCDLIVMASHGRRGLSALVLGSETSKVLTHSKIPVLVCR